LIQTQPVFQPTQDLFSEFAASRSAATGPRVRRGRLAGSQRAHRGPLPRCAPASRRIMQNLCCKRNTQSSGRSAGKPPAAAATPLPTTTRSGFDRKKSTRAGERPARSSFCLQSRRGTSPRWRRCAQLLQPVRYQRGRCYVEMPFRLEGESSVEILVRTGGAKFRMTGQVLSTHPGFGMGVRFVLRDSGEREEVMRLVAVLSASFVRSTNRCAECLWCSRHPRWRTFSRDRARRHETPYATRSFSATTRRKIFQRKLEPARQLHFRLPAQQPFRFRISGHRCLGSSCGSASNWISLADPVVAITCRAHSRIVNSVDSQYSPAHAPNPKTLPRRRIHPLHRSHSKAACLASVAIHRKILPAQRPAT